MGYSISAFREFIAPKEPVILSGGFGTTLPLLGDYQLKPESWSGEANLSCPELVEKGHLAFLMAGADILTTNTFRTNEVFMNRVLENFKDYAVKLLQDCRVRSPIQRDFRNDGEELSYRASKYAVDAALTVKAKSDRHVLVSGSMGPIGDTHSYDPDKAIPFGQLLAAHKTQAHLLKELGVDVLFPETIPSLDEARAMAEAAAETELPYITSFVLDPATGNLFDTTTIEQAVKETESSNRTAVLFNCTPAPVIGRALDRALNCYDGYVGAFPNGGGKPAADKAGWIHDESPKAIGEFAAYILNWATKDERVKFLGGCCGADPSYIQGLNRVLREENYPPINMPLRPAQGFFAQSGSSKQPGCVCDTPLLRLVR